MKKRLKTNDVVCFRHKNFIVKASSAYCCLLVPLDKGDEPCVVNVNHLTKVNKVDIKQEFVRKRKEIVDYVNNCPFELTRKTKEVFVDVLVILTEYTNERKKYVCGEDSEEKADSSYVTEPLPIELISSQLDL